MRKFFHNKLLLVIDKFITLIILFLLGFFRPDYLLIAVFLLLIPYLVLTKRKHLLAHLIVASILAFIWVLIVGERYNYNQSFITIAGINIYSFFAWALGLCAVYTIYEHYKKAIEPVVFFKQLLLFSAIYWPLLIFGETIAYHLLNIKNLYASRYAGLPLCNCMHGPIWLKISYFLLGPIFLFICQRLGLEKN